MRKEDLFLKYCCQCAIDTETRTKAETLLKDGLNWNYLLNNAEYQRIQIVMYLRIKKLGLERLVPEKIMVHLRQVYQNNAEKNLCMMSELKRLLVQFKKENIKIIVLKGVVLEEIIHSEVGQKPISDIDFLIYEEDYGKADSLLKSEGYLCLKSKEKMFWQQKYYHLQKGIEIDLHWHFFTVREYHKISQMDMSEIWKKVVVREFEGVDVLTLSLEDTLLTLCLHFAVHHLFCELILLFEISEFVRKYREEIIWEAFIANAKKYRVKNGVYFTLSFAKAILNTPVPVFIIGTLKPNYLRKWLLYNFFVNEEGLLSLKAGRRRQRWTNWGVSSCIIADNIIDSIKAFLVSFSILKETKPIFNRVGEEL